MKKTILFLFVVLFVFILLNYKTFTNQHLITINNNGIKYKGYQLDTKQSLPRLFIQSPLELNKNAKYSYTVFNDLQSNTEFIRIDKKIIQYGTTWFDNVTVFYAYDKQTNKFKRVLVSPEEQNKARFPKTDIVSLYPLTIKFYYDISRLDSCYGADCLAYWADFYRWDSRKNEFKLVNQEYKDFYQDLLKQYEDMNKKGCNLGDVENKGLITFEEVYKSNSTNYCKGSTREELNKFFQTKYNILNILK